MLISGDTEHVLVIPSAFLFLFALLWIIGFWSYLRFCVLHNYTNIRCFSVHFTSYKQISAQTSAPCVTGDYVFSNIQPKFFNVYMEQRVETLIRHTM